MEDRIERYIRSGHSGLCIVSLEERRVEAELKRAAEKLGDEHDFEEWPEWMFARHIPGECPRPLPAVMELYLEDDPAICAEFRTRVQAHVRRLQSQHARP